MSDDRIEQMRQKVAAKMNKWSNTSVFGYESEPEPERKEGDIWEDHNGKKWTVKNGIRQNITKLDGARIPAFCPKCDKTMGHRFDTKFFVLYKQCFDCTIKQHTKMMADGTWAAFEKSIMRNNEKAYLRDKIDEYKDYIRTFKVPQIHFEDGRWEELATLSQFTEMFDEIKKDIQLCENKLKQIEEEEQNEQHG